MTNQNTIFCRQLLKGTLSSVKAKCKQLGIDYKVLKQNAWGYKYTGYDMVEFHINKNIHCPNGFYWYGQGESITQAKAEGWQAWLDNLTY